jgi:hypothetical protein
VTDPTPCNACCRFSAPGATCEKCGAPLRSPAQAKSDADMALMFVAYTVNQLSKAKE